MMARVRKWLKGETVFSIAALLALFSMVLVPPDLKYLAYVDCKVLAMLFCLMMVVAGFRRIGLFDFLGRWLAGRASGSRSLNLILVFLCFFTSMLITNDVALLTFVPFAVLILQMTGQQKHLIFVVVMQTIAANLGSMATPVGNPQNLYLYSLSGMKPTEFLLIMFPLTMLAFLLLLIVLLTGRNEPLVLDGELKADRFAFGKKGILYTALFVCCMLSVARVLPYQIMLVVVLGAAVIFDRAALREPDYALLATFVCFFLFIGNMQRIEPVRRILEQVLQGREMITSILASQVISNVPAAVLLSGFTREIRPLMYGTNLGGLGTLIASLASLISYKCYARVPGADKGAYLKCFTGWNLLFLAFLTLAVELVL